MDTTSADEKLKGFLARWDQGDNMALGRELEKSFDLKCQPSWRAYAQQITKLIGRELESTEIAKLRYFYWKFCPTFGPEKRPSRPPQS